MCVRVCVYVRKCEHACKTGRGLAVVSERESLLGFHRVTGQQDTPKPLAGASPAAPNNPDSLPLQSPSAGGRTETQRALCHEQSSR